MADNVIDSSMQVYMFCEIMTWFIVLSIAQSIIAMKETPISTYTKVHSLNNSAYLYPVNKKLGKSRRDEIKIILMHVDLFFLWLTRFKK